MLHSHVRWRLMTLLNEQEARAFNRFAYGLARDTTCIVYSIPGTGLLASIGTSQKYVRSYRLDRRNSRQKWNEYVPSQG